jgi:pilus assembly protein FimV
MTAPNRSGERDRDRALMKLRWLTVASGIASLVAAALGTSAAAQASTRPAAAAGAAPGSLTAQQLAALNFALPRQSTVVIWQTPGRTAATAGRAPATGRAPVAAPGPTAAPAAAPAPRPAPTPPPPPVATTGTS